MLEAKAKPEGHSRKCSPKNNTKNKDLQKSFSGDLQFIGVARIFDWRGGQRNFCGKKFSKEEFLWEKIS